MPKAHAEANHADFPRIAPTADCISDPNFAAEATDMVASGKRQMLRGQSDSVTVSGAQGRKNSDGKESWIENRGLSAPGEIYGLLGFHEVSRAGRP